MPPQAFASLRGLADNVGHRNFLRFAPHLLTPLSQMERIQTFALAAFDGTPFSSPKVELAARFGHLVTRHLGLCQLVRPVLRLRFDSSTDIYFF